MDGKFALIFVLTILSGCCSLTPSGPAVNVTTGPGQNELAGKTFDALADLGVPLECDISTQTNGEPINVKIYMKGRSEVRSEIETDGECTRMAGILKTDSYYVGCMDKAIFANCSWIQIPLTSSNESYGEFEAPDYSNIPPSQISCRVWAYDPAKFSPTGTTCTIEDLISYS